MPQFVMFPRAEKAPGELRRLSGPCGPISVWMVLARHNIDAAPSDIIRACRYTDEHGCFATNLALALGEFGLAATLHTDTDPAPKELELDAYKTITCAPASSIRRLLRLVETGSSVILSYLAPGGDGHFSPLAGRKGKKLLLPYSVEGEMLTSVFGKRWRAAEICRQAVVAA